MASRRPSTDPSIQKRKEDTFCNLCGEKGHWAGDECCSGVPAPGLGARVGLQKRKPVADRNTVRRVAFQENAVPLVDEDEDTFNDNYMQISGEKLRDTRPQVRCAICQAAFHEAVDCPDRPRCKLCRGKLLPGPTLEAGMMCVACGPVLDMSDIMVNEMVPHHMPTDIIEVYSTIAAKRSDMSRVMVLDTACRKTTSGEYWQAKPSPLSRRTKAVAQSS